MCWKICRPLRRETRATMNRFPGLKTRWAWVAGTFFGAGLMKPGPGTWGSVAALVLWWVLAHAGTIVARETGREDPGHVVLDEVAGQWITLIACPVDWKHALLALLFFRVFDIVKPWPARQLENLPGGWGIMLDDVAAGLYALLVLQIVRHWF